MKKIYHKPSIQSVVIKPMQIICSSSLEEAGYTSGNVTSGDARRGRFSGWDEDFDSEE